MDIFKDFSIEKTDINTFFNSLFSEYALLVNDFIFYFGELELYYYEAGKEKQYDNKLCFKRDKKAGEIFFHDWGLDICFKSEKDDSGNLVKYGGVLVRSLIKNNNLIKQNIKCGPLASLGAILSRAVFDNGETKLNLYCKKLENSVPVELQKTIRIIGKTNEPHENKQLWRFIRKDLENIILNRGKSDYYRKRITAIINN